MISAESLIQSIGDKPLPPVEQWDPPFCGALDLLIKADGSWLYTGTPMTRHKMKLLFSRVIKKQDDDYFLVTPVEKVSIQVEWQPFVIIDHRIIQFNGQSVYEFVDNLDNTIQLTEPAQLQFSQFQSQSLPIIQVRRNLFASFSRNCYYRLIAEAKIQQQHDRHQLEINSNGLTFSLGEFTE